ncbi:MAG: hypothetical protein AAGA65_11225 [Actinomycetota bacterium]
MSRPRLLVTIAVLVALLVPAVLDRDSFPHSTYPMYARSRGDVVSIDTATGTTPDGREERLSLAVIGNSDDPLIVAALVRDAVRSGQGELDALCSGIADRLAAGRAGTADDSAAEGPDRISVVSERHNVVDRAAGRPSLVSREVHATCPVPS